MNNHKKAFDILQQMEASDDIAAEYKQLVLAIAIARPSAIVKASRFTPTVYTLEYYTASVLAPVYSKIGCIKIIRAISNMGLKDAKQFVETACPDNKYGSTSCAVLSPEKAIADFDKWRSS